MIKSIQYKAAKIHYRVLGAGSPVLLLHGFGEDSRIWEGTIADLSKQFLLIVPDLPGSGPSQLMQGEISMESMAEAVLEILKNEIPDLSAAPVNRKPVLIGHSMGGYITLAFAEKYPQLLKAFGLFHSTAFADSEEKKQVRQKSIAFIRQHGAAKFIEQSTPNLFSLQFSKKYPEIVRQQVELYTNFSPSALVSYYEAMMKRPDRSGVLKNFEGPILFIIGKHDNAIPLKDSLQQCHMPKTSYVRILENSGHMGMLEEAEKSVSFLKMFLTEIEMDQG